MGPALQDSDDATLLAVASRSPERATSTANLLQARRAYNLYNDALRDREVDAVYVALPNSLHAKWVEAALLAGKHVLVEKPLTAITSVAQRLTRLAWEHDRLLVEGYMYRHHPQWRVMLELLQENSGNDSVSLMRSHIGYSLLDQHDIRLRAELGGGALLDVGCYVVNAATVVMGRAVQANKRVVRSSDKGVDLFTAGTLEFRGNRLATFDCDFIHGWTTSPLELRSERATLLLEHAYNPGEASTTVHLDQPGHERFSVAVEGHNAYLLMIETMITNLRYGARSIFARTEAALIRDTAANMELLRLASHGSAVTNIPAT